MPHHRELVNPSELHPAPGFSHLALAEGARLVFVAGQVALDREFNVVGGDDLGAQARAAMENVKVALETAGAWAALEPKFVYGDSVRQVLDYVARGEAEAGFVYRTDAALMADKVKVVQTVEGHAPVRYPVAVVADSRQKALARDFVAFLGGAEAQAILARFGFARP